MVKVVDTPGGHTMVAKSARDIKQFFGESFSNSTANKSVKSKSVANHKKNRGRSSSTSSRKTVLSSHTEASFDNSEVTISNSAFSEDDYFQNKIQDSYFSLRLSKPSKPTVTD